MFKVNLVLFGLQHISLNDAIHLLNGGEEIIVVLDGHRFGIELVDGQDSDEIIEWMSRVSSRSIIYWQNQRIAKRASDFFSPKLQLSLNYSVAFLLVSLANSLYVGIKGNPITGAEMVFVLGPLFASLFYFAGLLSLANDLRKLLTRVYSREINSLRNSP